MITLNLWSADTALKQRLAARLEFELCSLGYNVDRIPVMLTAEDAFDWEEDARVQGVDVCIAEAPYPQHSPTNAATYYDVVSHPVLDALLIGINKSDVARDAKFIKHLERHNLTSALDITMEYTIPRYMARTIIDQLERRAKSEIYFTGAAKEKSRRIKTPAKSKADKVVGTTQTSQASGDN